MEIHGRQLLELRARRGALAFELRLQFGRPPDWNQAWRGPLRAALDWLRDTLAPVFEAQRQPLLKDPWAARDEYIRVILDRSDASVEAFLRRTCQPCPERRRPSHRAEAAGDAAACDADVHQLRLVF